MLVRIITLSCLFAPVAFAQDATTITLPAPDVAHAIDFLHHGGNYAEGVDLAAKLREEAQADIAKQQTAAKAAQTPATPQVVPPSSVESK